MHAEARRIIEKHSFRQEGCRYAMTTQTKSFGMTIHAQLLLRCRTHAMFTHEIARVNQMVVGTHAFFTKIDVTRIAAILSEVFFMRVTTAAGSHFGAKDFAAAGDIDVAAYAITGSSRGMGAMFESEMFPCHFGTTSSLRQTVATIAISIIMRFFMTIDAILGRGHVQWPFFASSGSSRVATTAMNPFEHVGAMFENASFRRTNSQNGCASGRKKESRAQEERRCFRLHGPLHV